MFDVLALRIREARSAASLSQQQAAEVFGVSPPMVSQYENAHAVPGLDKLKRFADKTGHSFASFFLEDDERIVKGELQPPTSRQALDVLTELVERAEKVERVLSFLGRVDRDEWPDGLARLVDELEGKGGPSAGSAKSGQEKRTPSTDFAGEHKKRKGSHKKAQEEA